MNKHLSTSAQAHIGYSQFSQKLINLVYVNGITIAPYEICAGHWYWPDFKWKLENLSISNNKIIRIISLSTYFSCLICVMCPRLIRSMFLDQCFIVHNVMFSSREVTTSRNMGRRWRAMWGKSTSIKCVWRTWTWRNYCFSGISCFHYLASDVEFLKILSLFWIEVLTQ